MRHPNEDREPLAHAYRAAAAAADRLQAVYDAEPKEDNAEASVKADEARDEARREWFGTPLADAYVEAAKRSEAAKAKLEEEWSFSNRELCDAASMARYSAREEWLESDECREYVYGGDSGSETRGHWSVPSYASDDLQKWTESGDWDVSEGSVWVSDWARPIDPVTGDDLRDYEVTSCHAFQQPEPECSSSAGHEWKILREKRVKLGVVRIRTCAHCGVCATCAPWPPDQAGGEEGLFKTTYRAKQG